MTASAPASLLLAWWGTAWLRGLTSTDHLVDALQSAAAVHSVHPSPDDRSGAWDHVEGASLVPLLAALRRSGATAVGATFPAEGDPIGLGGPRPFNLDATDVGQALLCRDAALGAVPHHVGAGMTWVVHSVRPRPLPDVAEADRGLRSAVLATVDTLERLDVASWSPDLADEVLNLRHLPPVPEVPGVSSRLRSLTARALSARAVVEVALLDDGGAVSARESAERSRAVKELDRAARAALSAAATAWSWPPDLPEA